MHIWGLHLETVSGDASGVCVWEAWASGNCLLLLLKNSCLTIVILITTTSEVIVVANTVVVSFTD